VYERIVKFSLCQKISPCSIVFALFILLHAISALRFISTTGQQLHF
jgi:hypothetical protein